MVTKELVHGDRVDQSLASFFISATSSRKRDRCDVNVTENSNNTTACGNIADNSNSLFRSKKRFNSAENNVLKATAHSESREDISDDDGEELEELALLYRTTIFREQRQLPESPYSLRYNGEDENEKGFSPASIGAHPTIMRAKTINEDSSSDYIDPPDMTSSRSYDFYECQESGCGEENAAYQKYQKRGVGEDTRDEPEWLSGPHSHVSWSLPKKGAEPLFTSFQRDSSERNY